MKNFMIAVEWEDGVLYITEENGSGCKYYANTPEEIAEKVKEYAEGMVE